MTTIERGMILDINLEPVQGSVTAWTEKKAQIKTNVILTPSPINGLDKKSVADCLQTRPIDYRLRLSKARGKLEQDDMRMIDHALKVVFSL
jgi:mRNA interferase MazF